MIDQTTYSEEEVHKCAKDLCFILNVAHLKRHFQAIYKKYSVPKFYEVAPFCKSISETMEQQQAKMMQDTPTVQ